ncbi:NAD(P)-binding protein [Aspergillus heteromorphus CBS 117.55]|uniref:NAD(P)-binding protein n=1 Tax=Aspergillus heteromorphus CBS 117.55 TaxID=1448321 RepID=A0A317X0G4_9EURO|nr:NAD(P)-binding protein [Aspergillus heteromorphus CBS 117.55]PWY92043.1 NAD(P)-binding protein [Aspergillus heteromorphus CBS 117.55]
MTSASRPVVAIAGATGHLGRHVASAFISSPLSSHFSEIVLLSRSQQTQSNPTQLKDPYPTTNTTIKVTTRTYSYETLPTALQGIDILINAIGPSGHAFKETLLRALPHTSVQVYFPSEFGVNHYIHDFAHPEWDAKKRHMSLATQLVPHTKRCRVFCGLFFEDSIGPWFGFDTTNGVYESVGSAEARVSFTSLGDVGRVVAALATLAREMIPDVVHVGGIRGRWRRLRWLWRRVDVREAELEEFKRETTKVVSRDPARFLRFLMGEGRIDHSSEGLGIIGLSGLAKEAGGRPWRDYPWPPQ